MEHKNNNNDQRNIIKKSSRNRNNNKIHQNKSLRMKILGNLNKTKNKKMKKNSNKRIPVNSTGDDEIFEEATKDTKSIIRDKKKDLL